MGAKNSIFIPHFVFYTLGTDNKTSGLVGNDTHTFILLCQTGSVNDYDM